VEFKDYYQILGVPPDADQKTIKQAYRKLARQHHPDVNPGNKEAEERFKEINEAYQALSNAEQRKKYDDLRAQYLRWQQTGARQPGGRPQQDFNWQDWAARPGEGPRVQYYTSEDMEDLFGGESPFSDFFTSIFGQAPGRGGPGRPRPRRGQDLEVEVALPLEEAYRGGARQIQIGDRRIEAQIPPGVRTGSRIRLAGQGEPGRDGAPPGDLYLVTRLLPHPTFELEGDDLHTEVPVDIYTAVLGGEVQVPTLDRPVMLKIPPRTQSGRSFRLRGKGMPRLGQPGTRGDLYARSRLVLPEPMTEAEVNAIRELAATRGTRQPA
jgi:curved DNA-binding protein